MVWAQRVLASLMASVISDSFWQRAISKSETCFLQWSLRQDLVASSHPKAYPPLLEVESHLWGVLVLNPKVSTGREISSRVRSSGSASSGTLTCRDAWEEVSTGLAKPSSPREGGAPKARDTGLFEVDLPNAWPEVSRATCNRSSLTSMIILTWLSALGGRIHSRACGGSRGLTTAKKWGLQLMSFCHELWEVHL